MGTTVLFGAILFLVIVMAGIVVRTMVAMVGMQHRDRCAYRGDERHAVIGSGDLHGSL